MGIIRLLLAIAVVIAHSTSIFGFRMVEGAIAVQAFYIISGFYMALVLNEKYVGQAHSYRLFITNRLLRLYPIYWVVLALSVLGSVGGYWLTGNPFKLSAYFDALPYIQPGALAYLVLTNLVVVGQDAVFFLGLNPQTGGLFFAPDFHATKPPVYMFMFLPQAWTLGVEILFYLVAPFLVRRRVSVLVLLALGSLAIRLGLHQLGLSNDPWSYRFFPSEILFFLVGAICYRAYLVLKTRPVDWRVYQAMLGAALLVLLSYHWLPTDLPKRVLYYLFFALSVPFLFILTKKSRLDYRLGELSYPVYISHMFTGSVVKLVLDKAHVPEAWFGLVLVVVTVLFSLVLVRFIAEPVERYRQRRVRRFQQPEPTPEAHLGPTVMVLPA
ncbi:acyltransferase [Hymenobacter algoricola]|uniref:Acyltransferase n=1 Tax=Hymenobacter algoricola TaxID=486267 RepID=A0ABP7MB18_9BACT